jgi:hypothetical protein
VIKPSHQRDQAVRGSSRPGSVGRGIYERDDAANSRHTRFVIPSRYRQSLDSWQVWSDVAMRWFLRFSYISTGKAADFSTGRPRFMYLLLRGHSIAMCCVDALLGTQHVGIRQRSFATPSVALPLVPRFRLEGGAPDSHPVPTVCRFADINLQAAWIKRVYENPTG